MSNDITTTAPTATVTRATWWHPAGFWTTGTFLDATDEQVTASITRARGTRISLSTD